MRKVNRARKSEHEKIRKRGYTELDTSGGGGGKERERGEENKRKEKGDREERKRTQEP